MASNVRPIHDDRLIAAMLAARAAVRPRREANDASAEAAIEEWWQVVLNDPRVRPPRRASRDDLPERIRLEDYPRATIEVTCDKCTLHRQPTADN